MVCDEIEQFCKKSFNQSLNETFLCILREVNGGEVSHTLILDILANGVLPLFRIDLCKFYLKLNYLLVEKSQRLFLSFLANFPVSSSISSIRAMEFNKQSLRLPLKMDENVDNSGSNRQLSINFSGPISQTRMCIYNQISKS